MVHSGELRDEKLGKRKWPMALQVIEHTVNTEAPPAAVFALLADGSTWPRWSPIDAFELEAPGAGDPEGVGAIRVFTTGRHVSRERVVTVQPDEVFSYELLSGMAIRDYRAVVTLSPLGDGTSIHWRSTFRAKLPLSGRLYQRELGRFIGQVVDGLARAAGSAV
jgi:uncharacterized protein YndB with AHSA1/START domain